MKRVILESPFAGDVGHNIKYARACLRDCIVNYKEAPIASHLLYTQDGVLDDDIPEERELGINCGLAWGVEAEATVVYIDHSISKGMKYGIKRAEKEGRDVVYRKLYDKAGCEYCCHTGYIPTKFDGGGCSNFVICPRCLNGGKE